MSPRVKGRLAAVGVVLVGLALLVMSVSCATPMEAHDHAAAMGLVVPRPIDDCADRDIRVLRMSEPRTRWPRSWSCTERRYADQP